MEKFPLIQKLGLKMYDACWTQPELVVKAADLEAILTKAEQDWEQYLIDQQQEAIKRGVPQPKLHSESRFSWFWGRK